MSQPASGSHVPAAGISAVWEQMAACLQPSQQKARIHTGRQLCHAEPAEELQEDHRAALRSVTPKVSGACRCAAFVYIIHDGLCLVCLGAEADLQMCRAVPLCTPSDPRPCCMVLLVSYHLSNEMTMF